MFKLIARMPKSFTALLIMFECFIQYNSFDSLTKLFLDSYYLAKFFDASAKSFFPYG